MQTLPFDSHDESTQQEFDFEPFGTILQPLIGEAVKECGLATVRNGTKLRPIFVIWLVLVLTIRRDLNLHKAVNWMGSTGISVVDLS